MKINIIDGSISFNGNAIQRPLDRAHFLGSTLGRSSKEDFVNEDWYHYRIEPEAGIFGTLFFKGERLDRVFLLMEIPSDLSNEWTEELELARKAKHDAWLHRELGDPPYKYAWGRVDSEFDGKGCVSEIIVTYAD